MEWTSIVDCAYDATITVADESDNKIVVDIQLKDFEGKNLTVPACVYAYCCVASDGLVKETHTNSSEIAIEAYGNLEIELAKTSYTLISNATGHIDLDMTDTGTNSYYFCVVMPNGKLVVSAVITFTT